MGMSWAKEIKKQLALGKRYLKSDYKVMVCYRRQGGVEGSGKKDSKRRNKFGKINSIFISRILINEDRGMVLICPFLNNISVPCFEYQIFLTPVLLWVHISMTSDVPDHCRKYALSDPDVNV